MTQQDSNQILIICPFVSPNQGGVESHIQKLTSFIFKQKYFSKVITYKPLTTPVTAPSYEKFPEYEVYRMPWFGNGLFPKIEHNPILTFLYLVPGLLLLSLWIGIKSHKSYQVIHAHGMAAGVSGVVLKWLLKKRLVLSTHAIYNLSERNTLSFFLKLLFSQCDMVLAVGEPSRDEIIELGILPDKVKVHPNWVDTDFFSPKKRQNKQPKILFVGRGLEKKGIFLFGELAKLNPSISFLARLGDGPDLPKFVEKYSNLNNLKIKTELPKDFDHKMKILADEYRQSDIFIMPSLYEEGFASVVLESASSGLAIISSNLGCLPSMLTGSGAILIEPKLSNFDQEIKHLLSNPDILKEKQVQMRQFAMEKFGDTNAQVIWYSYLVSDNAI